METAKAYRWNVTGDWTVCESCELTTTEQKNIAKPSQNTSSKPSECLILDISLAKTTSIGGAKFLCLVVDKDLKMKLSFFMKEKLQF
jgi:hypothetical protein